MENLIWAAVLWVLALLLIPFPRIKQLWLAIVFGFICIFLVNALSISMGYYKFTRYLALIAGVPCFHIVGGAAGGLLLINWLPRNALYKIPYLLIFSALLSASEIIFVHFNAFKYIKWDTLTSFMVSIAALALYIWLCLGTIGEEQIYKGNKTRFLGKAR